MRPAVPGLLSTSSVTVTWGRCPRCGAPGPLIAPRAGVPQVIVPQCCGGTGQFPLRVRTGPGIARARAAHDSPGER